MSFYTYDYLVSQSQVSHWLEFALFFIIVAGILLSGALYMRNKFRTKYRDLGVIFFLSGLFLLGIYYSNYSSSQEDTEGLSQMATFLDSYRANHQVSASTLAVNALRPQNGMLVKEGNDFYRIDFNSDFTAYRINQVYLIDSKNIKLIDRKQGN